MVAVYTNREPEELPPLTDTVDPDALEAIFVPRPDGTRRPGGEVRFTYASCRVRVKADREIVVEPTHEGG